MAGDVWRRGSSAVACRVALQRVCNPLFRLLRGCSHTEIRRRFTALAVADPRRKIMRAALAALIAIAAAQDPDWDPINANRKWPVDSIYEIEVEDLESGLPVELIYFRGQVMLITNVASYCGHTERKYSELNDLHLRYNARGLSILGFPCNQFNSQEPGTSDQIMSFTKKKGVRFELFQKVEVNGPKAHPLFKYLRGEHIPSNGCEDDDQLPELRRRRARQRRLHGPRANCRQAVRAAAGASPGLNFESLWPKGELVKGIRRAPC